ncbi:GTPase-activator protein, partial [Opisthorchis viverrini]
MREFSKWKNMAEEPQHANEHKHACCTGQMVKSERSSIPCLQSLEKQHQDPSKQTVLSLHTKLQSDDLRDELSTALSEYKHTARSHSKSVNPNRFNRRLRAKTFAALADHVWSPFGYDETTSLNVSVPSLAAQSTPTDINLTGNAVSNSLSALDAAFEVSHAVLPDNPNPSVHCQLVRRTPSRLQRFLRTLRRSFSFQHVGLDEPTQPHIPGVSQQIQASSVRLSSDRLHTERHRRPKSNARLSRLFQCITVGDVNRVNEHSGLFLLRNDTSPNLEWMGNLHGNRFYSCPGGSYPNCVALVPLSDSLMETGTPNDSGHVTRSSTTPLFPVGDSVGSVSFIGSGHQRSVPPHGSTQLLARLDTAPGYLLTCSGFVHFGALHPTLTGGREFCFFCSAPASTCIKSSEYQRLSSDAALLCRIFAAPSFLSRLRWLRSLRRTAKPNLENERHRENSLKLSILEARNLSSKRRQVIEQMNRLPAFLETRSNGLFLSFIYYCDICLDRTLYARTTSKTATNGIFWAEDFDLNNLPNVSVMTISLYKEADSSNKDSRRFGTTRLGSKKYRKSQNQLVGFVTIPMSEISGRNDVQAWLNLQPPTEPGPRDSATVLMPVFSAHQDSLSGLAASNGLVRFGSSSVLSPTYNQQASTTQLNHLVTDQRDLPQIRIRARYQSVDILPIRNYWALKKFVLEHSIELTTWLEHVLPVKAKEEVASSLIGLHECNGTLVEFLTDLVRRDVANLENESMAFRSNTMATKAVECFLKMAGSTYLHDLLYRLVQKVLACLTAWEVNPEKLSSSAIASGSLTIGDTATFAKTGSIGFSPPSGRPLPGSLLGNQILLLHHLNAVWRAIQSSLPQFPRFVLFFSTVHSKRPQGSVVCHHGGVSHYCFLAVCGNCLMRVFCSFRETLEPTHGPEFCDNLISACIFLRLICPALLSPSLFGLVSAFPSEPSCQRNLTLLAKSLQSLANFSAFDDKEPYMRFLNGFVSSQMSAMRTFIRNISTWPTLTGRTDDPDTVNGFRDVIDEAFELANLHLLLSDLPKPCNGEASKIPGGTLPPGELTQLPQLLDNLSEKLRETLTPSTHSLSDLNGTQTAFQTTTERLNKTLPSRTAKSSGNRFPTSDFSSLSTSQLSTENQTTDYAFHSIPVSSPQPYYTLHQNPGFHNPKEQRTRPVNILSPPAPSAPDDGRSVSQGQCVATLFTTNDYDEPYNSPHPDSEDESYNVNGGHNGHEDYPPPPPVPERLTNLSHARRSSSHIDDLRALSLPMAHSVPTGLDGTRGADDEPVYDFVPSSDASSTDDLVLTNEKYLYGSTSHQALQTSSDRNATSLQRKSKQSSPRELVKNRFSSRAEVNTTEEPESKSTEADVCTMGTALSAEHTARSPRMVSKQVAKAKVVLTRNNQVAPPVSLKPIAAKSPLETGLQSSSRQADVPIVFSPREDRKFSITRNGGDSYHPQNGASRVEHRPLPNPVNPLLDETTYDEVDGDFTGNSTKIQAETSGTPVFDACEVPMNPAVAHTDGLEHEVVRLRHQLELSRADAARAANRLSQQEAELAHLRQLLSQLRAQPQLNRFPSALSNQMSLRATVREILSEPSCNPKTTASEKFGLDCSAGRGIGTSFTELDDAMARLEREQAELQQEQARIRARMAASQQTKPVSQPKHNSYLSEASKAHPMDVPASSSQAGTVSSAELRPSAQTHSYVQPTKPVRYGPRVRHDPPPQPRKGTFSRRDVY